MDNNVARAAPLSAHPSEMADRVAAFDWSATPLGPMDAWPQALRIAVGICLDSRFPMFVWWGPDHINIYNDAYIPMLGKRHPAALGRRARDSWDDIWDVVGPQGEAVIQRGEATWNDRVLLVMERHGYVEETWFTWSYSPIPDGQGGIGGLFCAVTEETPRVLAERERDLLLARVENERARLAEAFGQSPAFLAVLHGPGHVIEFANRRYRDLVGGRDIIGRRLGDALPEVGAQGYIEILDRVYATGEPYVGSGRRVVLQRSAGRAAEEFFLDFVYQPLRDADGRVGGILVHGIDATARHRSEERDRFLIRLEDALRPLADPDEITACGAKLLCEHLEADRCAYADVESDEDTFNLTGDYTRGVPSIVGRYRFGQFGEEVLALMRAGKPFVVNDVDRHEPPLGDLAAYRATQIRAVICVPLMKAGRFVAAMAVHQKVPREWTPADVDVVLDVANRCYESIERARVERSLRESESRFRELADAMPQIVFTADASGHVDYFNRRWYEYTGLPDGAVGEDSWRSVHTDEGLRRVAEAWPEALASGQPYEIEYPLRRHDGAYRWHLGRALPIRDAAGEIVRWFGTNTDIDDRKRMEEAIGKALRAEQQARSEAELASRMKDEFLATLSHELRTPLNAILGWSHILRNSKSVPKELERGADVIERNARAQATIIDDLLDMSAIISGKARIEVRDVDLAAIVRTAVETARPAAEAKRVRILLDADTLPGATVRGDPNRLQQVMWNLLTNAIKFTPAEGRVMVTVRRADAAHAEIVVTDSGEGIAREFLPHVFERFRQADPSSTRRHGGLGLGLAIVKQLVELHGGSVVAQSAGAGRGATFTITLPIAAQAVDPPHEPAFGSRPSPRFELAPEDREALAGKRILVVDDEADARELVGQLLRDCGAEATIVGTSAEALAALGRARYDVLVSDIGMPVEDGYALMRRVRGLQPEANGDIPAIALTAYARPDDRARALRAGFQLHAPKPLEPGSLLTLVARLAREGAAARG